MKANEFVKENGIEKCKRILDDLTDQGHNGDFYKELKRLVESHRIVESYGGIDEAKDFISPYSVEQLNKKIYSPMLRVKEAIADVEN